MPALLESQFSDLALMSRGKVRDLYNVKAEDRSLLLVATDRISAFDHVLGSGIPGKGKVLTQISLFWFDLLASLVPNHLITAEVEEYPREFEPYAEDLRGRSMLVRKARMFPVECVARGYLSGSGWKDYQASQSVCGMALPAGLVESERLCGPLFTPASKSLHGEHDENISFDTMVARVGAETAETLRGLTLAIYAKASAHAEACGLILADTKFEFGVIVEGDRDTEEGSETIVLADEALTPDSSRYWLRDGYRAGRAQLSFDKQYVRDYLEQEGWNKQAPAPALPEDVIRKTQQKYFDAYQLLTGRHLEP